MALYRLDYCDESGNAVLGVTGADIGILPTDQVLTAHMQTARARAIQAAEKSERDVLVSGIVKGGRIRPALIVRPDGSATRPGGTKAPRKQDDCKRDSGERCFCPACRAERRAAR